MMPGISLITTLYNEAQSIEAFLESYRRQTRLADEFIIVDGGSSDGTTQIIERYSRAHPELNICLIVDPSCSRRASRGPVARGRNVAIARAAHEDIAVTDAGCVLHQHWLQEITSPLVDPDVHIVSGWYEPLGEGPFQTMYRDCFLLALEDLDVAEFLPSSRSMALRKACWSAVGGYPIAAATAEDTGFCLTLRGHGFCFYFAPAAVVFWRAPQNLREAMVKHFRYAHGDGVMGLYVTQYLIKMAMIPIPLTIILPQKRRRHFFGAYPIFLAEQIGFLTGYALARCREDALERI